MVADHCGSKIQVRAGGIDRVPAIGESFQGLSRASDRRVIRTHGG